MKRFPITARRRLPVGVLVAAWLPLLAASALALGADESRIKEIGRAHV